ncbi:hypothetical protein YPPY13_1576 [Yersinia pestis PY-13]|uniref:Uncharacterized protein n=1 Tax=Yersinia pseudotuberculosis serotype O:1b (strain IP 31758) TaxID=349747 RepID=A0A0U1QXP9_YERP3|nr:hypothetical protein YpsIP31758_2685 [Yersinia pseudotuberculosis IP 31758]EDR40993.1 hypothetical protein YpF1991016_0381 [Yersinia pestis biovar Orientalis str. F1991016]EDR58205.1 hypothetical protein YpMG051020_0630 [Yersinia pestis biovar Orientalis str. MG05-1020]EDR61779.1 hypothetical protein YpUG050454_1973 [Yersinia pestis biovar Antiqua str. UG05-0454]EDR66622.1 hypothetical protein YpK1973002_1232 [Yersinia pestis biovar Mediaevalis str. K1973002]EFA46346.1 conserved hypothetica
MNRFSFNAKKARDPFSSGDAITLKRFNYCVSGSQYMQVFRVYS